MLELTLWLALMTSCYADASDWSDARATAAYTRILTTEGASLWNLNNAFLETATALMCGYTRRLSPQTWSVAVSKNNESPDAGTSSPRIAILPPNAVVLASVESAASA
jgi:hypothetical protein